MPTQPRMMTAHTLNPTQGWPRPNALFQTAKFSANVTVDPVFSGRVVHVNSDGEFELGVPDVAKSLKVPMYLFPNSDDPDVSNYGGNPATDPDAWVPVAPTGTALALPAIGCYQVETTEFEPESSVGSPYNINDGVTAVASNSNAVTGGRITKANAYEKPICGIVAAPVKKNSHKRDVLTLWTYFLPRHT